MVDQQLEQEFENAGSETARNLRLIPQRSFEDC